MARQLTHDEIFEMIKKRAAELEQEANELHRMLEKLEETWDDEEEGD